MSLFIRFSICAIYLTLSAAQAYADFALHIKDIVMDAVTPDGSHFAEKLGFHFVCGSHHNSKIYAMGYEAFLENSKTIYLYGNGSMEAQEHKAKG